MRSLTISDPGFLGALKKSSPLDFHPVVWLDASDTSTIVASGSPLKVSQWTGKSGNAFNLTQSVSSSQPTTGTTTINGLNTIYFDGNDKLIYLNADLFSNASAATIFVVGSGTVSTAGNKGLFLVRTATGDAARAQVLAVSGQVQVGGRRLDADTYQSVNASSISDNVPFMAGAIFDWSNAQLYANLNGVLTQRSGGFQTAGTVQSSVDDIGIGQNPRTTGNSYIGSIGEIIVYPQILSVNERLFIESYLRAKWGTP